MLGGQGGECEQGSDPESAGCPQNAPLSMAWLALELCRSREEVSQVAAPSPGAVNKGGGPGPLAIEKPGHPLLCRQEAAILDMS